MLGKRSTSLLLFLALLMSLLVSAPAAAREADPCPDRHTPPAGYVPLFDGETLNGWTQAGPGGFVVADCGLLQPHGGMGLLWYDQREFTDFTMRVDFRVHDPADNAGVFMRFPDPGDDPWVGVNQGYEVQIYEATDDPLTRTGAIYTFAPAEPLATNPIGEWNTMEIEAIGHEYRVILNGTEVATYTGDGSRGLEGYVGLQNHSRGQTAGESVEFRDVWIKDLTQPEGPCPEPDSRETVVLGDVDSDVANHALDNGCTINDLIDDEGEWPNKGAFMRHVKDVTSELVADGVITRKERGTITNAAARSDVGHRNGPPERTAQPH
ncbi:3-keto-disaccharide hydrolase [Saccharomonospora saliphila]|uniref:3-keto-disaccharide hydrolase n=1 Tax=Saccharomonospora saliphila TaxID=369829 RepID=UPI0003778408|nr:DUF1080 domain-containing protein [Saccharomonospora saliphila]